MGVVIWSPKSTTDFEGILAYLITEWGESAALDFAEEVDRILRIIQSKPELYPLANSRKARKAVIVKQVSLFYRVESKSSNIRLLRFWDNRQNPKRLKY